MKKSLNGFLAVLLSNAVMISSVGASPLSVNDNTDIYYSETFNECLTGDNSVDNLTISGGQTIIAETSKNNKALYLKRSNGFTSLIANCSADKNEDIVLSVDLMSDSAPVSLKIGVSSSVTAVPSTDANLVSVVDNQIQTTDGKEIGSVKNNDFTTIAAVVKDGQYLDVYIDNKQAVKNHKINKVTGTFAAVRRTNGNPCYVDNIRFYKGDKVVNNMSVRAFRKDYVDKIAVDDTKGDHVFFDSTQCRIANNGISYTYYNSGIVFAPKSNTIVCTRLMDYQSPDRTNYIYMERTNSTDDCYFDVPLNRYAPTTGLGGKNYKYFKVEGDIKIDEFDRTLRLPMIRDNITAGSNDFSIVVGSDGSITSSSGTTVSKAIPKGKWFHYLVAINLDSRLIEVYVDSKKIMETQITNDGIRQLTLMRISLGNGDTLGKMYIDNFDITGLDKPVVDGVETKTDFFASDDDIREFLTGKIAMHTYGNNLYKNGVKTHFANEGIYDDKTQQFYLCAQELNNAFDINLQDADGVIDGDVSIGADGVVTKSDGDKITLEYTPLIKDGKMYVPVRQFAEDVLGKYVWWFKTGILIFSDDRPVKIDTKNWNYYSMRQGESYGNEIDFLNAFLQYERPEADTLLNDLKANMGEDVLSQHPRLFLTKTDFDKHREHYKSGDDAVYSAIAQKYINAADKYLDNWQVPYAWDDFMRTISHVSNNLVARFFAWGYAYQLTGDQKYVDAAYKLFEQVATYPDFNPGHIIDFGTSMNGLAIGFDWLYDGFSTEQRETVKKVVRDKALDVLASGMYGKIISETMGMPCGRHFKQVNNFNGIINGGVVVGAIATIEYDTEEALTYISDSLRSVEYALAMLPPEGGWTESIHYWSLNMESLCDLLASMQRIFGKSYGLADGQGMSTTIDYVINCLGVGGTNNYGDAVQETIHSFDIFAYLGKLLNNSTALKLRRDELTETNGVDATQRDIMYYDFAQNVSLNEDSDSKFDPMLVTAGPEVVSFRDSFDFDKMQTYFSAHFGTTTGFHQQDDCGTFVLDLLGERWAYDLGMSDYLLQNTGKYKGEQLYRVRAEGHNMIVLNPQNYTDAELVTKSNVYAPITEAKSSEYGGYVYTDMSEVYSREANSMKIGYYIDDNISSVTYRNEFNVDKETDVMWSLHTKANITIDNDAVYLSQNGKTVKIELLCKNGTDIKWSDNDPVRLPVSSQPAEETQDKAMRKLMLTYKAGAGDNVLAIKISPANEMTKKLVDTTISEWQVPGRADIQDANLNFSVYANDLLLIDTKVPVYSETMPQMKVVAEDPSAIVEFEQPKDVSDITLIKVWDKTRTAVNIAKFSYFKSDGTDMAQFNTVPIQDISVSSTPESQNNKDNIIDSDLTTRWTGMTLGDYAVADIGSVQKIDGVAAAFWKGTERTYYFDVYTSVDGTNWTMAYSDGKNSAGVEALEAFGFDESKNARYIKIVGKGNSTMGATSVYINLLELQILKNKYN